MADPPATSLQTIARLNNRAVALLGTADVVTASGLLQNAFEAFQLVSHILRADWEEVRDVDRNLATNNSVKYGKLDTTLCDGSLALSPNNIFPLCPHAFLLPDEDGMEVTLSKSAQFCTILLYNLSLAQYCLGMVRGEQLILKRSLRFVDIALSFYDNEERGGDLGLVLLALKCNRGHLLSHFGHVDQLLDCQADMYSTLRRVQLEPDDWMFFFALAFHLRECGLPTLAASA